METKLCFDGFLFVKWGQGKDNLNEEKVYTIWGKEEELSIWVSIKKTEKRGSLNPGQMEKSPCSDQNRLIWKERHWSQEERQLVQPKISSVWKKGQICMWPFSTEVLFGGERIISPKTVLFPLGVRKISLAVTGREIKARKRCTNCRGAYQLQFLSPRMMPWKWQYFFTPRGKKRRQRTKKKKKTFLSFSIA